MSGGVLAVLFNVSIVDAWWGRALSLLHCHVPSFCLLHNQIKHFLTASIFELIFALFNCLSEVKDFCDQLSVVVHVGLVVFLVKGCDFGVSCFKLGDRVRKVLSLSLIFLLDVSIHFNRSKLLVLNVVIQILLNGAFQLLIIVDVLDDPVYRVFKSPDEDLVCLDLDPRLLDYLVHVLLFDP